MSIELLLLIIIIVITWELWSTILIVIFFTILMGISVVAEWVMDMIDKIKGVK